MRVGEIYAVTDEPCFWTKNLVTQGHPCLDNMSEFSSLLRSVVLLPMYELPLKTILGEVGKGIGLAQTRGSQNSLSSQAQARGRPCGSQGCAQA